MISEVRLIAKSLVLEEDLGHGFAVNLEIVIFLCRINLNGADCASYTRTSTTMARALGSSEIPASMRTHHLGEGDNGIKSVFKADGGYRRLPADSSVSADGNDRKAERFRLLV